MTDYTKLTPLERYDEAARLASEVFQTSQWKTPFCKKYGLTNQTPTKWVKIGAPLWAVQAMRDARDLQRIQEATASLRDVLADLD